MATLLFDRAAVAAASSFQVLVAVGPEQASATRGKNWKPCARGQGVEVLVLPVLIVNGSTATIGCGCCSLPLPKATGHGRVKSCRVVQPPGRHPDIGACSSGRGGRSPLFSISGLWPAACTRAASRERRRWSRFVRSPPHGHRTGPQCRHARGMRCLCQTKPAAGACEPGP